MKTNLLLLWTCLHLLPGLGHAEANDPNTDWFKDARYGVFMHFLPGNAKGPALVKDFDVEALAGQLGSMGARHFVLTLEPKS
jgi:hypothetical protein